MNYEVEEEELKENHTYRSIVEWSGELLQENESRNE
jgi:hypothetical protein